MVEITREKMEKLYKKQQTEMAAVTLISCVCFGLGYIIMRIFGINVPVFLLMFLPFVIMIAASKKLTPPGQGLTVRQAFAVLKYDFTSDRAVNVLFDYIGKAGNFADKTMLTLNLCETYMFGGKVNEALSMLDSVDRQRFIEYPTIGLTFYSDVIEFYGDLQDYDSVLAAYKDAEAFVDECAFRNYICCQSALNILIAVEKARGNYRKALDMQLMKNDFENRFNAQTEQTQGTYPLKAFLKGISLYRTAELLYLCGDNANAGRYLDTGGPMLSASTVYLNKANELSEKIRRAANKV